MNFITYARTSTRDQILGIESQIAICQSYADNHNGTILSIFSEHESGKNDNRQELRNAINACKEHNATLLIAKLDRLSRRVAFLFTLKEELEQANVKWIAIDNPDVSGNTLLLGIFGGMAQSERELISLRTKQALQAKKARGEKLGGTRTCSDGRTNMQHATAASIQTKKTNARSFAEKVYPQIMSYLNLGMSMNKTAQTLNSLNVPTAKGGQWTAKAISNVLSIMAA